jgi:putative Mn2+ efflux pump MntP
MSTARKAFWAGGIAAGVLLIVLGAIWIWMGATARAEVRDTIEREQITGTPDMRPGGIETDVVEELPTCDVAEQPINSGDRARCFAEYMRVHALQGTGGRTFSEMGRFLDEEGNEVFSAEEAATNPDTGRPVENPARQLWVSQRALATGLELAYVGEQVSLFSIATGALFIVIGIGFIVMLLVGGVLGRPFGSSGHGAAEGSPRAP